MFKKTIEFELDCEPVIGLAIGYQRGWTPTLQVLVLCFVLNIKFLKKKKKS